MLMTWRERHKRLAGRIGLVFVATLAVDAVGTVAIYLLERHVRGTEVHTFGQALFFSTVQILTVSSQIKNPVTPAGRKGKRSVTWAWIPGAGSHRWRQAS